MRLFFSGGSLLAIGEQAQKDMAKVEKVKSIFDQLNIRKLAIDEMNLFYNFWGRPADFASSRLDHGFGSLLGRLR